MDPRLYFNSGAGNCVSEDLNNKQIEKSFEIHESAKDHRSKFAHDSDADILMMCYVLVYMIGQPLNLLGVWTKYPIPCWIITFVPSTLIMAYYLISKWQKITKFRKIISLAFFVAILILPIVGIFFL